MKHVTRRDLLCHSGLATATGLGLPLARSAASEGPANQGRKLKIVVVGGHPDDPESGCGGTIARYADEGHDVVNLYLTRGEAGIRGKKHEEAARIRSTEADKACRILKARPRFAGQIDGATEVNRQRYDAFWELMQEEKPDLVFTHWPIDAHRDHRVASLLVYDTWLRSDRRFALYYYEVMSGLQTQHFWPTDYVDITQTEARKRAACFAHASQKPEGFYGYHEPMNVFRGLECGCKYAEGFARHVQSGALL